jgi:hypothetical protein
MGEQPKTRDKESLSTAQYASELVRNGVKVLPGSHGTFWVRYEIGAMVRMPEVHLEPPAISEIRQVLWQGRVAVVSYLLEPDQRHSSNGWLYVCRDQSYSLEKLSKAGRRDVRRAQRSLGIKFMNWPTLLEHGFEAFRQTRTRVGLSDGILNNFRRRFEFFSRNPAHHVIGAWKGDLLVAFMTLIVVDDRVEIEGSFSTDDHRSLCPNDGLVHHVLDHFLVQRGFHVVDYGLSSIQEENGAQGLHAFKKKMGFETQPVHRVFVLHPVLRPFANPITLWGVKRVLRFRRGDRFLKKADGALSYMLRQNSGELQ